MADARPAAGTTLARLLVAAGVALALADASVVTLALPQILTRLNTTIDGVAAVIGVYTVVLAAAVLVAVPLRRRLGSGALGAAGMLLFALASAACGLAESLELLLAARAAQAVGAGAGLVAGYALLHRDGRPAGRPDALWVAGAVFGTAIGPALGGALTELFDWRAIFLAQAPFGLLAGLACLAPFGPRAAPAPAADPAAATPVDAPEGAARPWPTPAGRPPRSTARPAAHDAPTEIVGGPPEAEDGDDATLLRPRPGGHDDRTLRKSPAPAAGPVTVADDERETGPTPPARDRARVGVALALLSAALTAVVFLLVLLLVSGWAVQPLKAAVGVTVLPIAALAGSRIGGDPWLRASAGAGLVGAGVLALATLPTVGPGWVVVPQLLSGLGMGMALPAMAGELLPERSPREAAQLLSLRHVGITVALLILAPVTAAQLDRTIDRTRQQVVALVLDAKLPPQPKLESIGPALADIDEEDPRGKLRAALTAQAPRFAGDPEQAAVYAHLVDRADETLITAVNRAFRPAFLITGLLALLAALLALPPVGRSPALAIAICGLGLAAAGGQALMARAAAPPAVVIANPCERRDLPTSGGLGGALQDTALLGLDGAACKWGSSREELALAIGDPDLAKAYQREHGHDPRSPIELAGAAITGGGGDRGFGDVLKNLIGGG
ncbi:MFS transporter [Patulibacter defluvii]|uniref:MFS transporter n=1 Tax=Patulibacter defluvii TaxID=3095358 RepID=UPI002A748BD4|nr:MFS transporter [Patulibacter sp. DM4]